MFIPRDHCQTREIFYRSGSVFRRVHGVERIVRIFCSQYTLVSLKVFNTKIYYCSVENIEMVVDLI